jgi:hypothetical protein
VTRGIHRSSTCGTHFKHFQHAIFPIPGDTCHPSFGDTLSIVTSYGHVISRSYFLWEISYQIKLSSLDPQTVGMPKTEDLEHQSVEWLTRQLREIIILGDFNAQKTQASKALKCRIFEASEPRSATSLCESEPLGGIQTVYSKTPKPRRDRDARHPSVETHGIHLALTLGAHLLRYVALISSIFRSIICTILSDMCHPSFHDTSAIRLQASTSLREILI